MKNNQVFILCDTNSNRWQMKCANAERHVESRFFAVRVEHDEECLLSAVSPRRILDGHENDAKEKYRKMKNALKGCKYVYAVDGWWEDPMCVRLERAARWRFKKFIVEEY